ncbi:MAG: hypothetical protein AAFY07_04685 [Pseudomonadota bacterium]
MSNFSTRHLEFASGSVMFALALLASPLSAEPNVAHPDIPCWIGERTASTSGGDFVIWDTQNEAKPYLIIHDRELMLEIGEPTQLDYNYLTYSFGDESAPIQARHYLGSYEVSLLLPLLKDRSLLLEDARPKVPTLVLRHLQKRYFGLTILTETEYKALWELGAASD